MLHQLTVTILFLVSIVSSLWIGSSYPFYEEPELEKKSAIDPDTNKTVVIYEINESITWAGIVAVLLFISSIILFIMMCMAWYFLRFD